MTGTPLCQAPASRSGQWTYVALAILILADAYLLGVHVSYAAGGSDSSGYLNTAKAILRGTVAEPLEALRALGLPDQSADLFIPLGYTKGPRSATMAPFYPSGLPLHMLIAAQLGGWDRGPFWVSPACAIGSLLLIYLLARDFGLSQLTSLLAASLLAANPTVLFQGVQPMSDVPAMMWAILTILAARKARGSYWWAAAAGASLGVAVLIRPADLLLLVPLAMALPARVRHAAAATLGGLPALLILTIYNRACYGSALLEGYTKGGIGGLLAWSNFPTRAEHYVHWLLVTLSPLVPVAWLGLTIDTRTGLRDRLQLLLWPLSFFLFYCFYGPYETWWYTRFLLPGIPGLIIGALVAAKDFMGLPRLAILPRYRAVGAVVLAAAAIGIEVHQVRSLGALGIAEGERAYPDATRWAARVIPPDALVLSMQFSGALKYYTSLSYVRWDQLNDQNKPGLMRAAASHDRSWYALLAQFEVRDCQSRVAGRWTQIGQVRGVSLWHVTTTVGGSAANGVSRIHREVALREQVS